MSSTFAATSSARSGTYYSGRLSGIRLVQDGDPIFGQEVEDRALTAADVQYPERGGPFTEPLYDVGDYPVALILVEGQVQPLAEHPHSRSTFSLISPMPEHCIDAWGDLSDRAGYQPASFS